MSKDQRTSESDVPVTIGQANLMARVVTNYPGGKEKFNLAQGHVDFKRGNWKLLDDLAAERTRLLPIEKRPIWVVLDRTCNSAREYRVSLEANDCKSSERARHMLSCSEFDRGFKVDSVKLVVASVEELTGKDVPPIYEIHDAIRKAKGKLCPSWVGPELCKQLHKISGGSYFAMAMEDLESGSLPGAFTVCRDGNTLDCVVAGSHYHWNGQMQVVFCRRR